MRILSASFLAAAALIAACSLGAQDDRLVYRQPAALQDAYLIAHGMAASYAESAEADPAVVAQLARLDARASDAISTLARLPGGASEQEATAQAVSALTDYAARQTEVTQ